MSDKVENQFWGRSKKGGNNLAPANVIAEALEEQKIQAQRDIADLQLQIAKENKNKYDSKNSEDKK